ncbi:MAG TPA: MBL fold metallo-hydrolase [Actinomycetota bacterium]|nr:MBL fold metallo-hydrolase [Actinomycetota bacterium]
MRIWGCRGSLATPGPQTVRYGGNTSCIEVRLSDDSLVILDAGTGIRPLGLALDGPRPRRIDLLLTHLHLDHLEGLGFFPPLWDPQTELHIWGPPSPLESLQERIAVYLSPPLFPVHLSDVPSRPIFHDAPEDEVQIGSATVLSQPIIHSGPTVGYRIEDGGSVLAYLTDHEPAHGADLRSTAPEWISGFAIARGADLLIHDCQYTEAEYPAHVGWGHSSLGHVADFARIAKARHLLLFHHDPVRTDDELEVMLARVRELVGNDIEVDLAREGMELDLP